METLNMKPNPTSTPLMHRLLATAALVFSILLSACSSHAPVAEPGMEVLRHAHGEEMQIASDVDFGSYSKVILQAVPVEFREHWRRDQERLHGRPMRDEDVERIRKAVGVRFDKVMYDTLTGRGGYELTSESGPGVMRFLPNIVDLDVQEVGWIEGSILESLPESRGSMTVEIVIRDSVTDKLLAVAWQRQSDPRAGELEMTINVSNDQAFRLMSQNWANWLLAQLDKAKSGK
jgi:hypothetical protein